MKKILKYITLLMLVIACLVLIGCEVDINQPESNFPDWAAVTCFKAQDEAISIIRAVGVHSVKKTRVRVIFESGDLALNDNFYMCSHTSCRYGYATAYQIFIAIDQNRPEDPAAINYPILVHEFVHQLLMSNGYGGDHFPEYRGLVAYW